MADGLMDDNEMAPVAEEDISNLLMVSSSALADDAHADTLEEMVNEMKQSNIADMNIGIENDLMVANTFKYRVSWSWPFDAKFLILLSIPCFNEEEKIASIDPDRKITKYFETILGKGSFGIATCSLGHNGNRFQLHPTTQEFAATAKYLAEFIVNVQPLCIFTIDAFPAEALRCDLHPPTMYLSKMLHIDHVHLPQLSKAVDIGDLRRTNLRGRGSFRYITLPRFSLKGKGFKAAIMTHRDHLETFHIFPIRPKPICVYQYPYNFSKKHRDQYVNFDTFVARFLNDPIYERHNTRVNAALLPYGSRHPEFLFLTGLQYDYDYNYMRCFCTTTEGIPFLVTLTNVPFTFGFTPHAAFSMDPSSPSGGNFAGLADNLTSADLKLLHEEMCRKLRWVFKYQRKDLSRDISLWITEAHNHGESRFYGLRKIIQCKVSSYSLIRPIIQLLERLIKAWRPESDQHFTPVSFYSPEQVFSYAYKFKVCHWYRVRAPHHMRVEMPCDSNYKHVRQLECTMTFDEQEPPLIFLEGNAPVDAQRTANSMPPHVQIAMDIECVDETGHFPDPYKNAIICICNTVWRKDNLSIEVDAKTAIPNRGYLYVTFNLGLANPAHAHKSLMTGETIHYYFEDEANMLLCYGMWLHYMIPDYYMGHNFKAFDINYIVQRAATLNLNLPPLGRVNSEVVRVDRHKMSTRAFGDRYITSIRGMSGCCLLDFLEILLRDFKLESNTLDYAGSNMLGDTKLVMPYNALKGNWMKSPETFQKVIDYCVVDAQLVDRLINKKMCINGGISLSRVNGTVPPAQLWELGMQIKVFSTIAHIAKLRPPQYQVLFPSPDTWSYRHNDIVVERHMAKHASFEEGQEDDADKEPDPDTVVWRPTLSGRKRTSRGETIPEDQIKKKLESTKFVQGTLDISGEAVIDYIDEEALKRNEQSKKAKTTDETFEDFDKILREIRLNGGRENVPVDPNAGKASYTGAVVLDAPLGMYFDIPYLCMDFSGLYPSIIMAYNIGGDSLIFESERIAAGIPLDLVHTPPNVTHKNPRTGREEVFHFVHKEIWPSVIAEAEDFLKASRKEAQGKKADAAAAGDKNMESIYNALQNNFKLIMNSIYGALGVNKGPIACKAAAKAVTAWGRYWIMEMNRVCDTLFDAMLAGGDTDSIFKGFPGKWVNGKFIHRIRNREEGELFGPWLVNTILNPMLPKPMSLAYEKMMFYLLTTAKKRYNYIHIELGEAPKIADKGMETVRRDTTKYTKITLKYLQNHLLVMPSPELQKLLYPEPTMDNPFTYYTRYEHYIYNDHGLKFAPPPDYIMVPVDDAHSEAIHKWNCAEDKEAYLEELVKQWTRDEETYFSTQVNKLKHEKEEMVKYVQARAKELINGRVPLTQCIQSKQRSREHYKSDKQPHLTVIKNKEERGEDVPQIGERVRFAYRILPNDPNGKGRLQERKAYMCAEDPVRIIREGEPVNWPFYLHNTFVKPIVRYMRWVLKDEMIERIRARRDREKKRPSSFFRPVFNTLTADYKPEFTGAAASFEEDPLGEKDITLAEITEEVTQYLFMTPPKKSPLYRNLYTRYAKLIDTKKAIIPHNNKKISPIAQFRDKTNEDLKRIIAAHDITDMEDLFAKVSLQETKCTEEFEGCLKTCRACLGTEEVECENIDCAEFLPRISAEVELHKVRRDKGVLAQFRLSNPANSQDQ